jgi:hypothetical protein
VSVVAGVTYFYVGDPRTYELRAFDENASLRLIVRVTEPLPKPQLGQFELKKGSRSLVARSSRVASDSRPRTQPAFGEVRVDPSGRIWVQGYQDRGSWTVFDSSGRLLGGFKLTVNMPRSHRRLVGMDADHIVVKEWDTDGAAHLVFYRIVLER